MESSEVASNWLPKPSLQLIPTTPMVETKKRSSHLRSKKIKMLGLSERELLLEDLHYLNTLTSWDVKYLGLKCGLIFVKDEGNGLKFLKALEMTRCFMPPYFNGMWPTSFVALQQNLFNFCDADASAHYFYLHGHSSFSCLFKACSSLL